MSKRLIVLLVGVLAIAAVVAGCGGSNDDSTSGSTSGSDTGSDTTTTALTKAELIKKGDAICEQGNETIESEANEFAKENNVDTSKPTLKQKEEVIVAVVAPGVRAQAEEISDLGAPSGDEELVEAIVAAVEEGADKLEEDPRLLVDGKDPLSKSAKLAASYGFKVCGERE